VELPAGEYVLVPFTLEPGHHGHWTAEVRVGGECELIPMPSVASVLERAQIERAQRRSPTAETAATAAPAVDKAKATLARLKLDTTEEEEEEDDDDGWSVAGSEPEDERTRTLERHAAAHATAAATGQSFASALTTSLGAALGVNGGEASLSRRERKQRRRATLAAARRQHKHMAAQRQEITCSN
jgi:hypothetical protein